MRKPSRRPIIAKPRRTILIPVLVSQRRKRPETASAMTSKRSTLRTQSCAFAPLCPKSQRVVDQCRLLRNNEGLRLLGRTNEGHRLSGRTNEGHRLSGRTNEGREQDAWRTSRGHTLRVGKGSGLRGRTSEGQEKDADTFTSHPLSHTHRHRYRHSHPTLRVNEGCLTNNSR